MSRRLADTEGESFLTGDEVEQQEDRDEPFFDQMRYLAGTVVLITAVGVWWWAERTA